MLANRGSAQPGPIVDEIWRMLYASGGLAPRVTTPHPAVRPAADAFVGLLNAWKDETFTTRASALMQRQQAPHLREELAWEHAQLGDCTLGELRDSSDFDNGEYELDCERGEARLHVSVEIRGDVARWRGFSLTEFVAPHENVQNAAKAVVELLEKWDAAKFERTFAAQWTPERIRSFFGRVDEEFGRCSLGEARFARGPHIAEYLLDCEKQPAKLFLGIKGDRDPKIGMIRITPIVERECAPRSVLGLSRAGSE